MRAVPWMSWILASVLGLFSPLASATIISYEAVLGPEVAGATGSGSVSLAFDDTTNDLAINAVFSGLSGVTTVAHIHCCTAVPFAGTVGVAVTPGTLPGFPAGVFAGSYSAVIDLDLPGSFTGGFLTTFGGGTVDGARAALLAGLDSGNAYFNVHSSTFGGGEIRGFPQRVPEPGSLLLAVLALGLLSLTQVRRIRV